MKYEIPIARAFIKFNGPLITSYQILLVCNFMKWNNTILVLSESICIGMCFHWIWVMQHHLSVFSRNNGTCIVMKIWFSVYYFEKAFKIENYWTTPIFPIRIFYTKITKIWELFISINQFEIFNYLFLHESPQNDFKISTNSHQLFNLMPLKNEEMNTWEYCVSTDHTRCPCHQPPPSGPCNLPGKIPFFISSISLNWLLRVWC